LAEKIEATSRCKGFTLANHPYFKEEVESPKDRTSGQSVRQESGKVTNSPEITTLERL
jgi:hypothetical protein